MTDDVNRLEAHDADALHASQDSARLSQPRGCSAQQIDLLKIPRHHHARAEAKTREEHLHLRARRILRLIKNDKCVIERASAHIGKRRNLNQLTAHHLLIALRTEDVLQRIVERAQIWVDLLRQVTRQKAQMLSRLHRGTRENDAADFAVAECCHRHNDSEVGLSCSSRAHAKCHSMFADRP